jgi:hypothetical protein
MSNTEFDDTHYGPLALLNGVWKGDRGEDRAPEPDGEEINPYYEIISFEAAGAVTNAEEQTLSIVRYHQMVSRKSDKKVFHDQVGYWLWDSKTGSIIQTVTIPRAVTLLAGGTASETGDGEVVIEVIAEEGHKEWGILQSPFMEQKARTRKFTHTISIKGNRMRYRETTLIDIYGKPNFEHVDFNTLQRDS